MPDPFYPHVDLDFITDMMQKSGKLADDGIVKIGKSTTFVLAGNQAIWKRTTTVREFAEGEICLEQAIALGSRFNFLSSLMDWLEKNKKWKEGAFVA